MSGLDYRQAGVNMDGADALVRRIAPLAKQTHGPGVLAGIGGFAGLFQPPSGLADPVLVSGTDGVGTKLKLAIQLQKHDTIGIDLVAMCVNDIVTTGAHPLFFLDYFGTSQLDVEEASQVIGGVAEGCKQAGCALLGGETAELPGMYARGNYELVGFAVGVVERQRLIDGSRCASGDVLIGVGSSGLHSNGYSLAIKAVQERARIGLDTIPTGLKRPLGEAMLTPTRIYAKALAHVLKQHELHSICHITGGGLVENLPRVLPKGLAAKLRLASWPRPPLFDIVQRAGDIAEAEMRRVFNLGLGLVLAVPAEQADDILLSLHAAGEVAWAVGEVTPAGHKERVQFAD